MKILKVLIYIPAWFLFPTIFKGKRNIPKGKCIFVANHMSAIDPIIMEMSVWRTQYYLAKKELFKNKFVGGILKALNLIPVERGKPDLSAVKKSFKILNKGKILTIFPEGTRNKTEQDLTQVKAGAAMFAIKTKTPVVPVWIKNKPRVFRPNVLRFGKPFELAEFYDKKLDNETLHAVGEIIAEKLLENKIEKGKNK